MHLSLYKSLNLQVSPPRYFIFFPVSAWLPQFVYNGTVHAHVCDLCSVHFLLKQAELYQVGIRR